jgi:LytS/YehU family sensor histidine kinase
MVAVTDNEDRAFSVGAFDGVIHVVLTAPALWLIYRWQRKGKEQIHALQTQLGRSTANVDFLRSQINPHFLFNALNTIYGLAIQEKAERTSASVEKLGDMMRFMLSENIQERIQLSRELEYLDNYISLQKLRTDGNPHLTIEVDLPGDIDGTAKITPMLLIPFVENAFKHGISLQEPSHIKIFLELKGRTLYFDVHNSTHPKLSNDPEKNSNGIGLENVRLRLQHMYPGSHELLVRETSREFFVHLKIELE